ncbi:MAG: Fic family protein [Kiritimatiellae bacterium]|nr:Fic family protein [Kiritimatiellia bacterium]
MKSFSDILPKLESMPLVVTWTLQSIAEKRGCQELYTRQSPDKLRRLREYAMIESAVASNRIEGVEVDQDRVGTIVFGNGIMKDRDEEEVRGYRRALELIHTSSGDLPLSVEMICRLHALTRPSIWDSGKIREKECEIIQTYPDGTSRVRFRAIAPSKIREYLERAIEGYENILRDARIPALVALAAFNLDFLCIHPFRDGNGRVSRLLLLFMLYHLGYEAGRYVSMERLIELSKDRYYETLEKSSASWHEGKHDIWPYVEYLLFTIDELYQGFQQRFLQLTTRRGEKSTSVIEVLNAQEGEFTVRQIEFACPGVSRETIKAVLKKHADCFACTGHGVSARWRRIKEIIS